MNTVTIMRLDQDECRDFYRSRLCWNGGVPRNSTKMATRNADHTISAAIGRHKAIGIDKRNTRVPPRVR